MKTCKNVTENDSTNEFICLECGFMTGNFSRLEIDKDFEDGIYYEKRTHYEFQIEYCPNYGTKVEKE